MTWALFRAATVEWSMVYCMLVLTLVALTLGLRTPGLSPGGEEAIERGAHVYVRPIDVEAWSSACGVMDDEPRPYDVNAALRSDEDAFGDGATEGEGPPRRRYVRAGPDPFGATTIRLAR